MGKVSHSAQHGSISQGTDSPCLGSLLRWERRRPERSTSTRRATLKRPGTFITPDGKKLSKPPVTPLRKRQVSVSLLRANWAWGRERGLQALAP